jgi:aminoglycoside phosphotransferase (APT) family kinase protein
MPPEDLQPASAPDRLLNPQRVKVDLAAAQAVLAAHDPALRAERLAVFQDGSKSVLEVAVAGGRDPLVLKVYADQPAWSQPKEALVAGLIADRIGGLAPGWLAADDSRTVFPKPYALMTRLPGAPVRDRKGQPEAADLHRQMGALLRRLHAKPLEAFGYILGQGIAQPQASNLAYMRAAFAAKFRDFAAHQGDPDLGGRLQAMVEARWDAMAACPAPALCHNDFHVGNVLAQPDEAGRWRVTGLVDYENAMAGDPLFDLAKAIDAMTHDDPAGREPLIEGYGAIDRPGWEDAILAYRIYHKLEFWNWLKGLKIEGPATDSFIADLRQIAGT